MASSRARTAEDFLKTRVSVEPRLERGAYLVLGFFCAGFFWLFPPLLGSSSPTLVLLFFRTTSLSTVDVARLRWLRVTDPVDRGGDRRCPCLLLSEDRVCRILIVVDGVDHGLRWWNGLSKVGGGDGNGGKSVDRVWEKCRQ